MSTPEWDARARLAFDRARTALVYLERGNQAEANRHLRSFGAAFDSQAPGGFTWADVDQIRAMRGRPSEYDGSTITDDDPALDSLADRIVALLPQRKP